MSGSNSPRSGQAPAWREGFCGRCGSFFAAGAKECPRCHTAPVELSWEERDSTRPRSVLGWIGFVFAALCLAVLLAWVLALLGWFLWKSAGKESWRAFEAVAVVLMIGILGCGLYLVVAAMAGGLVWSLRRTWRCTSALTGWSATRSPATAGGDARAAASV